MDDSPAPDERPSEAPASDSVPAAEAPASGLVARLRRRWTDASRAQRWFVGAFVAMVAVLVIALVLRARESASDEHAGHDAMAAEAGAEPPLESDRVALSERAKMLASVRTTRVRRTSPSGARVRLQGEVDYDESTLQTLSAWIPGRIDRLHLDTTGERVRRGQPVATIYSPEVYAAQQDLISARAQLARLSSGSDLVRSAANATLESARERLRLLGLPAREVARMERARSPQRHVVIRSPGAGTVIERLASEGAYVATGTPLYRVADLTRLWVQLDAYESDLPHLELGQTVEIEIDALPGEIFEGRVAFVDPVIDPRRRTARVRVAVANPERRLRPGMFVKAVVRAGDDKAEGGAAQPLVIPATAPLFTGRRSIVYVEVPDQPRPTYEARVVRLGPRVGDLYPVVAGLREGERVVTRGAFTLDADLQIRGGESMMAHGDDTERGPFDDIVQVGPDWRAALAGVLESYLGIQSRLADDDLAGARASAEELTDRLHDFDPSGPPRALLPWRRLAPHLEMHGRRTTEAETLEEARAELEPLTEAITGLLRVFGNPTGESVYVARCPSAFDERGAIWVQGRETIDNAYFGSAMSTCGSIEVEVAPGDYLAEEPSDEPPTRRRAPAGGHQH